MKSVLVVALVLLSACQARAESLIIGGKTYTCADAHRINRTASTYEKTLMKAMATEEQLSAYRRCLQTPHKWRVARRRGHR